MNCEIVHISQTVMQPVAAVALSQLCHAAPPGGPPASALELTYIVTAVHRSLRTIRRRHMPLLLTFYTASRYGGQRTS